MVDPGKLRFLNFARGGWGSATLANRVFWSLPGVIGACATLANRVFCTLPGVEWGSTTLANMFFYGLPGVRCDG